MTRVDKEYDLELSIRLPVVDRTVTGRRLSRAQWMASITVQSGDVQSLHLRGRQVPGMSMLIHRRDTDEDEAGQDHMKII